MIHPRRFTLVRDHDPTGVTGTGHVADGVQWPDGTATVRWASDRASTVHWDRIEDAIANPHRLDRRGHPQHRKHHADRPRRAENAPRNPVRRTERYRPQPLRRRP